MSPRRERAVGEKGWGKAKLGSCFGNVREAKQCFSNLSHFCTSFLIFTVFHITH